jgi:hypothetical protein
MNTQITLPLVKVYGDKLARHLLQKVDFKLLIYLIDTIQDLPSRIRQIGLVGVDTQDFYDEDDRSEAYYDARQRLWVKLDTLRKIINLYCSEEHQLPDFFEHFEVSEKLDEFLDEVREARKRKFMNRPDSLRSYAGVYLKVPNTEIPKGELCYGTFTERLNDQWTLIVLPVEGMRRRDWATIKNYVSRGAKVIRVIGKYSRSIDSKPLP